MSEVSREVDTALRKALLSSTTPSREAILTCLACGAKNPRALPYDMVAPDSCGECGVSLRSGDLGAIRDEALEEAARVADDLAEIARRGAILGQCDPLEAQLLDAGLSGCASAIRALKSQSPTKDAPDMVLVPRARLTAYRDSICGSWCDDEVHIAGCREITSLLSGAPGHD